MAVNTLIIEVGEKIVKVCVSTKKRRKIQILDSFMFQTPTRSVVDGQITDPETLAEALKEQIAANEIKDVKKVVYTLNSSKVATREITLPLVKENRIRTIIETNATEYFPVDLSGFQLTYSILEKIKGENGHYRILVLAVPRNMVNSYIRMTDILELPIEAIDYCGNSQYQVLRQIEDENVVMYVDINLSNTYVNFMENGVLLLQRNLAFGGDPLVSAVMAKDRREESAYLSVLQELSDVRYMDKVIPMRERKIALNRLTYNVLRMIDFFHTNFAGKQISKIVLMGTCSNIAGLTDMVREDTGLETVRSYELEAMKNIADSEDGVTFYLACIGTLIEPLNLLPEDYSTGRGKKKKKKTANTRTAKMVCAACVGVSLVLCGYVYVVNQSYESQLAEIRAKAEKLNDVKQIYSVYVSYERTNTNLKVLKDKKVTQNTYLVRFLEELEEKMPTELSVLSAECNNQGVTMNIKTSGYEEAAVTISQLRTFQSIETIQISSLSKSTAEDGTETVSFSISCVYGDLPTEEEQEVAE